MRARTLRIFLRAFLLEAAFDQDDKQRSGVAWVFADRPELAPKGPFNTNPSLSGYALGLLDSSEAATTERGVASLTAALGAIGDRLVWGILRPLAGVVSLLAAAAGPIPAAAALLLVYNPAELALRWRSIRRGNRGMGGILGDLDANRLPRLVGGLARVSAVAVGALGGYWLLDLALGGRLLEAGVLVVTTGIGWTALRRFRFGIWPSACFAILAAVIGCLVVRMI